MLRLLEPLRTRKACLLRLLEALLSVESSRLRLLEAGRTLARKASWLRGELRLELLLLGIEPSLDGILVSLSPLRHLRRSSSSMLMLSAPLGSWSEVRSVVYA